MRTKIKKSDPLYSFIKEREQKEKWIFLNAPHIKIMVFCLVASVLFFVLSYFSRPYHPWLSPLLQSLSVGIVTGLIVYVLGNMRTQREKYVLYILKQLTEIYEHEVRIYHAVPTRLELSFYTLGEGKKFNCEERVYEVFNAVDDYITALKKLEYSLLCEFIKETNLNFEQMESCVRKLRETIPDEIDYNYCWQLRKKLIEVIQDSASWIEKKREDYEIMQAQLNKYPL